MLRNIFTKFPKVHCVPQQQQHRQGELHDSVKQCAIELFLMIFKQHLVRCLWSVLTI